MKGILDEPPCRASMKNSGNKRMTKRKRSWKHKVKPCDDLDGASRRDNAENLELRKKDEQQAAKNFIPPGQTLKERINHLDETRIRIMLCVSFTNLNWWQATDLAYHLFLKKGLREIWRKLEKVFNEPPVGFGKNKWIDMITEEEKSWTNHRKNWQWK